MKAFLEKNFSMIKFVRFQNMYLCPGFFQDFLIGIKINQLSGSLFWPQIFLGFFSGMKQKEHTGSSWYFEREGFQLFVEVMDDCNREVKKKSVEIRPSIWNMIVVVLCG